MRHRLPLLTPLILFAGSLLLPAPAPAQTDGPAKPSLDELTRAMPQGVLQTDFMPLCQRPVKYAGYSFANQLELQEIKDNGANFAGLGAIWNPIKSPGEPFGVGSTPPFGNKSLAQSFTAPAAFDGFSAYTPTWTTIDNGCTWRLFRLGATESGDTGQPAGAPVAQGKWTGVRDNVVPEASFPAQPAGRYLFQISEPTGNRIGWWSLKGDTYKGGRAWCGSTAAPDLDYTFKLHTNGQWQVGCEGKEGQVAMSLGDVVLESMQKIGLSASLMVGNWNNPGFPIYPAWFFEAYPNAIALDQNGGKLVSGMIGEPRPAATIEAAADVSGTSRFIGQSVELYRDAPNLAYYVLGGESMYASYGQGERWFDYSADAIAHFRRWLEHKRYADIAALNHAWGAKYAGFGEIDAPRAPSLAQPWLDWLDFRFASMGERFGWHWQAVKSVDPNPNHPAISCNHGTIYHGSSYAALGASPEIYAAQSDGFETGQIMEDNDPDLYNMLYIQSMIGLGKPYCPARLAYRDSNPKARGGAKSFTPAAVRRYGYETLGSGAWHIGFCQWDREHIPDGEWEMKGTPGADAASRLFAQIRQLAPDLDGMQAMRPAVGWWLSHPTWALEGFKPAWLAFHKDTVANQISKLFVYDQQIVNGQADDYKVLVSLDNDLADTATLKALAGYVQRGGRLIVAGGLGGAQAGELPAVLRLPNVTSVKADALLATLSAEYAPVKLTSDQKIRIPVDQPVAVNLNDLPQDLFGHSSIGQTVRVSRDGLKKVAIHMPTFGKQNKTGFHFEIRENGPEGPVLAQRDVPGGIGDNSWVELDVPNPLAAGKTIYLAAVTDAQLGQAGLGWWSTPKDVEANGTAFIDGKPVTGDRQVKLAFDEPTPAPRAIESFVLSDGVNYGVIMINLSHEQVKLNVDLAGLIARPFAKLKYQAVSRLHADAWQSPGLESPRLAGTLSIDPQETEFLYLQPEGVESLAADAAREANLRVKTWKDKAALTPFAEYAAHAAAEATTSTGQRAGKTLAFALNTQHQLGLAVDAPAKFSGSAPAALTARLFDATGKPLDADRVWAEVTPSDGAVLPLDRAEPGVYRLMLSASRLPKVYDYAKQDYVPFHGPLALRVVARAGALGASRTMSMTAE